MATMTARAKQLKAERDRKAAISKAVTEKQQKPFNAAANKELSETYNIRAERQGAAPVDFRTGRDAQEEQAFQQSQAAGLIELQQKTNPLLVAGQQAAEQLKRPEKTNLAPQGELPAQQSFERNLPIFGSAAAALGTAYNADVTPSARFGVAIEATPVLGTIVGIARAGGLVNTPKSSAQSLSQQIPQVQSDIRNMIRNTADPAEALGGLNQIEVELAGLESSIAQNVAISAELRANPEDVDIIAKKIDTVKNLIFYYRREIVSNPANLQILQSQIAQTELIQGGLG